MGLIMTLLMMLGVIAVPTSSIAEELTLGYTLWFNMDVQEVLGEDGHSTPYEFGKVDPAVDAAWRTMKIYVTDSKGNTVEVNPVPADSDEWERRVNALYDPNEEVTIKVDTGTLPDGYHLSYTYEDEGSRQLLPVTKGGYDEVKVKMDGDNKFFRISLGKMDVRFDPTGGTIEGSSDPVDRRVNKDNTVDFPANPVKDKFTFDGWYTKSPEEYGGEIIKWTSQHKFSDYNRDWIDYNEESIDPLYDGIFLLRASWVAEVTFVNDGETHATVRVEPDKTINGDTLTDESMPEAPFKFGYVFKEWNTEQDGTGTAFTGDTKVSENMKVYAIYTKIDLPILPITPSPIKPMPAGALYIDPNTAVKPIEPKRELKGQTHYQYLQGYEDFTFKPENYMTREEVTVMLYRLLSDKPAKDHVYKYNFSDVDVNRWSAAAISYMNELGIIKGYPDGTFRPHTCITRAEFAAIITRFAKTTDKGGMATLF